MNYVCFVHDLVFSHVFELEVVLTLGSHFDAQPLPSFSGGARKRVRLYEGGRHHETPSLGAVVS